MRKLAAFVLLVAAALMVQPVVIEVNTPSVNTADGGDPAPPFPPPPPIPPALA